VQTTRTDLNAIIKVHSVLRNARIYLQYILHIL